MLKILNDFIFVCYDNFRSRAYSQALISENLIPKKVIILGKEQGLDMFSKFEKIKLPYSNFTFDPNKSISNSFKGIDLDIEEKIY